MLLTIDRHCEKLLLLNPYTREHNEFLNYQSLEVVSFAFGICYDCSDHDYKVVLMAYDAHLWRIGSILVFYFTIFSFKTYSWAKITLLPWWIDEISGGGVSVNGAPLWISVGKPYCNPDGNRYAIARFDLNLKDKFKGVPQPPVQY